MVIKPYHNVVNLNVHIILRKLEVLASIYFSTKKYNESHDDEVRSLFGDTINVIGISATPANRHVRSVYNYDGIMSAALSAALPYWSFHNLLSIIDLIQQKLVSI